MGYQGNQEENQDYQGDRGDQKGNSGKRPGYEYLAAYKLTVVIEDLTIEFCRRCKSPDFPDFPSNDSNH